MFKGTVVSGKIIKFDKGNTAIFSGNSFFFFHKKYITKFLKAI